MTHAEQYLVKATLMIDEHVVTTALAADPSLTEADDQAKVRALAMLGFGQASFQETNTGQPQAITEPSLAASNSAGAIPETSPDLTQEISKTPLSSLAPEPEIADSEDIGRPIDSITPDEAPAPSEVPASSLAAAAIENFDDTNPVDLSDIIAQTDVEMARLGWSSVQGRSYLEKTFNKRSRQQLTDEELLTFLLYLESQATPSIS